MSAGAWIMFLIGATFLWGGLAYFLAVAIRASRNRRNRGV
jgi:uncharacterized membrane protein YecN with MAPEG domain